MNIANELAVRQHIKIVVTGGVTRGQSYELIGPLASLVLAELTLDWAILGVDALDPRTGATAHHEGEASINHLMATRAEQVMIVTDSSKLGQRAFARVCATDEIDVIVTDRDARLTCWPLSPNAASASSPPSSPTPPAPAVPLAARGAAPPIHPFRAHLA